MNKNWTLFLDRDGVINRRLPDDYVRNWSAFQFESGALEAIAHCANYFGRMIVVTNQQGIGKGLMSEADLQHIHHLMVQEIRLAGGRIDRIYHCPHLRSDHCNCRKPSIGMALQAQSDFSEINFSHSIIVGDMPSDMEFGHRAGMCKVFISKDLNVPPHTDWRFDSLAHFANYLLQLPN
jgi:D-glycero-D-manno-heptose 1,7-bisphosphate phosphatase